MVRGRDMRAVRFVAQSWRVSEAEILAGDTSIVETSAALRFAIGDLGREVTNAVRRMFNRS